MEFKLRLLDQLFLKVWFKVLAKDSWTERVLFWLYIEIEFRLLPKAVVAGLESFSPSASITYVFFVFYFFPTKVVG